jgi:hypothetical protein
MMPVAKVPEPDCFDRKVRQPGKKWLSANPDAARPKPLWNECLGSLEEGFGGLCGYAAMFDPTGGTVDHYLSCSKHPKLTYEWSNYRFASAPLNASKKTADDAVLDPYEVGEGWFKIILPSMQMLLTDAVPPAHRVKAEYTIKRLKLRDGERIIRWRRQWYDMYLSGKLTLEGLRQVAPLIAEAVAKQETSPSADDGESRLA